MSFDGKSQPCRWRNFSRSKALLPNIQTDCFQKRIPWVSFSTESIVVSHFNDHTFLVNSPHTSGFHCPALNKMCNGQCLCTKPLSLQCRPPLCWNHFERGLVKKNWLVLPINCLLTRIAMKKICCYISKQQVHDRWPHNCSHKKLISVFAPFYITLAFFTLPCIRAFFVNRESAFLPMFFMSSVCS